MFKFITAILLASLLTLNLAQAQVSKIYWNENNNGRIFRSNLDGSNIEAVTAGTTYGALAVDSNNERVYFSDYINDGLFIMNLDGSNIIEINPDRTPSHVIVDVLNQKLVYSDVERIYKSNLDGTNEEILLDVDNFETLSGIALDAASNKIFYKFSSVNFFADGLYSIDLSDGANSVLVTAQGFIYGGTEIYATPDSQALLSLNNSNIFRFNRADSVVTTPFTEVAPTTFNSGAYDSANARFFMKYTQNYSAGTDSIRVVAADGSSSVEIISNTTLANAAANMIGKMALYTYTDSDVDGISDGNEACDSDPNKTEPGVCGCGVADADANANSITDCFPQDALYEEARALDLKVKALRVGKSVRKVRIASKKFRANIQAFDAIGYAEISNNLRRAVVRLRFLRATNASVEKFLAIKKKKARVAISQIQVKLQS